MAERMESYVMWALRSRNSSKMSIDDLERKAALDVAWSLRNRGLHVSRDHWESYDRELCYAHRKAREAIDRMLSKGTLRREGNAVMRANTGPSRECCYQIFSEIHSMEGPKYTELGRPSWGTQYRTEQVVAATHELERRGLIQGCYGYYDKHGGGAKRWYPTGKAFPLCWYPPEVALEWEAGE